MNVLSSEYPSDWDKIIKWDMPDQYPVARQDVVPNGIISQHSISIIVSGAAFNSSKFYDYNQYLSQLILLAQIVDEDFQKSIQDIYNIDKDSKEATISFTNIFEEQSKSTHKVGDGQVKYVRGPVKVLERARYKAQNDYADQQFPSSACVLDLNRCCLIFNDISEQSEILSIRPYDWDCTRQDGFMIMSKLVLNMLILS